MPAVRLPDHLSASLVCPLAAAGFLGSGDVFISAKPGWILQAALENKFFSNCSERASGRLQLLLCCLVCPAMTQQKQTAVAAQAETVLL